MRTFLSIIFIIIWLGITYVAYKPLVKGNEFQFKRALRFILWIVVIIVLAVILYELYELVAPEHILRRAR